MATKQWTLFIVCKTLLRVELWRFGKIWWAK